MTKSNYEFSVIKLVVNIARYEPVNVGVALLDKKNKTLYSRYVTNIDELRKRVGRDLGCFEILHKNYDAVEKNVDANILNEWHDTFSSVQCSKPTSVSIKNIEEDFEKLFNVLISVRDETDTVKKVVLNASDKHQFYISKAGRDYLRKRLGIKNTDDGEYAVLYDYRTQSNGRTRDDTILVEMLELLGEKAYHDDSGTYCKLCIVEIPSNMDYIVRRNAYREFVTERHREWHCEGTA